MWQMLIHIINRCKGIYNKLTLINLFNYRLFLIVLILDLTYKLFYYIFQGNHAGSTAKFVKYNSYLNAFLLQFGHQIVDLFCFRDEVRLADNIFQYNLFI